MAQAIYKFKASNLAILVKNELGEYIPVNGLNTVTMNRTMNTADTTTFDEGGMMSHLTTSGTFQFTCEGFLYMDPATGLMDEGQALVDSKVFAFGHAGFNDYRFIIKDDNGDDIKGYDFRASTSPSDIGGGVDDGISWGATLVGTGRMTVADLTPPLPLAAEGKKK